MALTFGGIVRLRLSLLSRHSCAPAHSPRDTRLQTYNMSAVDFNLGPFGIDAETNRSTCLGAFFNLNFGSGSRISWVVRRLEPSPSLALRVCSSRARSSSCKHSS